MVQTITRDELTEKIARRDKFRLLELLPEQDYHEGHLPGAINLPPGQLLTRASKLLGDRETEVVVYCGSPTDHASEDAARDLEAMGYTNVRDYAEGKQDWIEAGLPLEGAHKQE